ncbi:sulfotransferase [Deferribacter thermophilus]|uniref:sulfotransferase family protein n=1 Tax=Deferribacter thermophilus TaxID=53573 RepID=UPI003C18BB45
MKNIIFLFSLPRSGSTLLQRILMSHNEIASVAEPWLMLPFIYTFKKEGILTEYSHKVSYVAFEDFINNLPNKEDDYYKALRHFAENLYENQCKNNEKYFLDKTPRYYFIIPQIAKVFPDAKFIFLFRNPVHVMSSIIQTWCSGKLNQMYNFERDLYYGPQALSEGYKLLKDKSYAIQYEKFVIDPKKYIEEICEYLEIEFDENMLSNFVAQDTKGRLGDPTGIKEYKRIDTKSLDKWKYTFNTKFRKKYIKKYIQSLDESVFNIQGYNKQEILREIEELDVKNSISLQDRIGLIYSELVRILKPNIWFGRITKTWAKNRFLS